MGLKSKSLGGKSKGGKKHQVLCSEDLYCWQDGGEEVTSPLTGKGDASFGESMNTLRG